MLGGASSKAKSSPKEANERLGAVQVVDLQDPNDKAFFLVSIICVLLSGKKIMFFCLRGIRRGRKPQRKGTGGWSDNIDGGNDGDNSWLFGAGKSQRRRRQQRILQL